MTMVEGPRPGPRGGWGTPSADDVLVVAVEMALEGAGLPKAAVARDGHGPRAGFVAAPMTGAAEPRAVVTWQEDGKPADGPTGRLRDCEQALRRAGFHVEYTAADTDGYLLAWRRGTATAYFSRVALRRR